MQNGTWPSSQPQTGAERAHPELAELRHQLQQVEAARDQEAAEKRQVVAELQEAQIERASNGDLEGALVSWKQ